MGSSHSKVLWLNGRWCSQSISQIYDITKTTFLVKQTGNFNFKKEATLWATRSVLMKPWIGHCQTQLLQQRLCRLRIQQNPCRTYTIHWILADRDREQWSWKKRLSSYPMMWIPWEKSQTQGATCGEVIGKVNKLVMLITYWKTLTALARQKYENVQVSILDIWRDLKIPQKRGGNDWSGIFNTKL